MEQNGSSPRPAVTAPVRPFWATAALLAAGVIGGPLALLGLAIAAETIGVHDEAAVGVAYAAYVVIGIAAVSWRLIRPLGVGMLLGSLAVALMFLATGGLSEPTL